MRVTVPLPLPNKANTYEIHFAPFFWNAIKDIVAGLAQYRKPLYWIGPSKKVKDVERAIGFMALQSLTEDTEKSVAVDIWISDRLDADAIKACLDGIQLSGRIKNDRQVMELRIHKEKRKNTEFSFEITPLPEP
jgi:Holliday junction resolvase RusA-like endonuclease